MDSIDFKSKNIKLISKKNTDFKNYGFDEKNYCLVKIDVTEVEYNDTKKKYFYISYQYDYSKDLDKSTHPFYGNEYLLENHQDGEIIFKNELSDKLIEYLLMDEKKLYNKIGFGTVYNYKSSIMKMITHIWD